MNSTSPIFLIGAVAWFIILRGTAMVKTNRIVLEEIADQILKREAKRLRLSTDGVNFSSFSGPLKIRKTLNIGYRRSFA